MARGSIYRDGLFDGQTVVVSGGGTGIGRAIARELAALGATVVLCSRKKENLETMRDEIVAAVGKAAAAVLNIRDHDAVNAFFAATVAAYGPIAGLVNNAGGAGSLYKLQGTRSRATRPGRPLPVSTRSST